MQRRIIKECPMPYSPPANERQARIVGLNEAALYFGTGIAVGWLLGGPVGAALAGVATAAYSVGFVVAETRYRRDYD